MAVTDAPTGKQEPANVQAVIDETKLGRAIAQGMQQFLPTQQPKNDEPATSQFEKLYAEYASNEDNDKGTLDALKSMIEASSADIRNSMQGASEKKIAEAIQGERDRHTINLIKLSVDQHVPDEVNASDREYIRERVIHRFNKEDAFENDRLSYQQGDVPMEALKKIAIEEINRLSGNKQKANSPAGMKASDKISGGIAEDVEGNEDGGSGDDTELLNPDKLTEQEQDLFYAHLGLAQKMQHKRDSKEALAIASKAVFNLRKGKEKVKEAGLSRRK